MKKIQERKMETFDLGTIRTQIIGNDLVFKTPFGERNILYADYTASGRGMILIEEKLQNILRSYANTHTEDDYSGKYLTQLFHQALKRIKELVNAGEKGKIISVGSGSTGALKKLQEILGVYIPPATKKRIFQSIDRPGKSCEEDIQARIESERPVVFIGPYEHHTNELMWREAFVEVVVIGLDSQGRIDQTELAHKISDKKFRNRFKMASFSAGSNITGIRTEVYKIAKICHDNDSLIFFDFAAVAPYVEIDMNKDDDIYFDAIFFSPHKFLGGPGSSGILVFREGLYRNDLPPTTAGGGTVDYVGFHVHDYSKDIETREMAGTPPILQTIKAALAMDLKEKIGVSRIERIEAEYTKDFLSRLKRMPNIEMVGRVDPEEKIPIISFNIRHLDRILHPKFVTKLLNDLFGIQSRAGCSCAGPYGHLLLEIGDELSAKYRAVIQQGLLGLKPGWVRINIHYTFSKEDVDFLARAINFVATHGHLFLFQYLFDIHTGEWKHKEFQEYETDFSIENSFETKRADLSRIEEIRESYFQKAEKVAMDLKKAKASSFIQDEAEIEALKSFYYCS
jgi:selenocysteine lyase/cysteine desulfurase